MKARLIWRHGIDDREGKCCGYGYKTDVIELPPESNAFQFPDFISQGWLPELIGCEWIKEEGHDES